MPERQKRYMDSCGQMWQLALEQNTDDTGLFA